VLRVADWKENKADKESGNEAPNKPKVELATETEPEVAPQTESESEPKSEHEIDTDNYVNLADGITPTTTADADWAVVDA
jgi:adenine-specific DNA methylase